MLSKPKELTSLRDKSRCGAHKTCKNLLLTFALRSPRPAVLHSGVPTIHFVPRVAHLSIIWKNLFQRESTVKCSEQSSTLDLVMAQYPRVICFRNGLFRFLPVKFKKVNSYVAAS